MIKLHRSVLLALAFSLPASSFADDVTIELDAGGGFSILENGTQAQLFRLDSDGTIALRNASFIHRTGPNSTFVGTANLFNNTGNSNTGMGAAALKEISSGGNNSALGAFALLRTTIGNQNTALGDNALAQNVDGSNNIAVGYLAGFDIISGSNDNIFISNRGIAGDSGQIRIGTVGTHTDAYLAGLFDNPVTGQFVVVDANGKLGATDMPELSLPVGGAFTLKASDDSDVFKVTEDGIVFVGGSSFIHRTGPNATFVGQANLLNNTGANNSGIGAAALQSNTTGQSNTALGAFALSNNMSGFNNTAVGKDALSNSTANFGDTAVGVGALSAYVSGGQNTAVGSSALRAIINGDNNTAIGTQALYQAVQGTDNIAIGFQAGVDLLQGSNNIYIGARGSANEDGQILIGGTAHKNTILRTNLSVHGVATMLDTTVIGDATIQGNATVETLTIVGGADIAEPFAVRERDEFELGSILSIDPSGNGELKVSEREYDTRVAGVVSGAGNLNAGMLLTQKDSEGVPVALTGRVYVLADADANGPIVPGNLLTSSAHRGHAMRATDPERSQGAILGKAMSKLESGKGLVLLLVSLQ